jgi:hypothetical protein
MEGRASFIFTPGTWPRSMVSLPSVWITGSAARHSSLRPCTIPSVRFDGRVRRQKSATSIPTACALPEDRRAVPIDGELVAELKDGPAKTEWDSLLIFYFGNLKCALDCFRVVDMEGRP